MSQQTAGCRAVDTLGQRKCFSLGFLTQHTARFYFLLYTSCIFLSNEYYYFLIRIHWTMRYFMHYLKYFRTFKELQGLLVGQLKISSKTGHPTAPPCSQHETHWQAQTFKARWECSQLVTSRGRSRWEASGMSMVSGSSALCVLFLCVQLDTGRNDTSAEPHKERPAPGRRESNCTDRHALL